MVADAGKVPRVTPVDREGAMRRAAEFLEARYAAQEFLRDKYEPQLSTYLRGGYVGERYWEVRRAVEAYNKASRNLSHPQRIAALRALEKREE